ncbi:response regulator transcription factor [Nocardia terpenica]|uniref:DNA-binding response regulator n=1 Tax=Nocardia terpenica TaxID=455432 RepID=A0A164J127_9NOCA|nr:response regulator transcription factor [Nocardia terpenica]KZM69936.1 DNA-binding response regulator [Nocardia terpenica]MBF6065947.1 response regulator transcription factor [Nocardia terpenica]MBF6108857.1 response regulator transcription factor [Nocardia terpenica]MBF6116191.1 response regulator transcription factor [Nocardia terpenica]MBF6123192.1 response regulator transcription factor [Nocardia terpenica]
MRVMIAEDSALLREGIAALLRENGIEVAATVGDGDALLAALADDRPDVCVVDVRMPPTFVDEGLRAALAIRSSWPGVGVLVLSQYVEERYAVDLIGADKSRGAPDGGGLGYLLKDRVSEVDDFVDALARVHRGETVLDPEVVKQLLARSRKQDPLATLSARERQVLAAMAEGRSNAGISTELVIGAAAVEKHIRNIFTKLGLPAEDGDNRRVLAVLHYLGVFE